MLFDDVLSKQPRYDWGLCAIVAILAAAGRAKLLSPEYDEEELLLQIVRDTNRTQLAKVDVEVAEKLLNDIFWCQPPPNKSDNALGDSIVNAIEALQLWLDDELCVKVLQLHELLSLRRCVFVVGSAGAGKTTIWKTLKLAKETKNPAGLVNLELVYPNVFDVAEFYGSYDPTSSEWKDGALTSALKRLDGFYEIGNAHHENWLVLDGLFVAVFS